MDFDFSSFFKAKTKPVFGMDISSSAVKMVELSPGPKGGVRVDRYAVELLPRDAVTDGNIAALEVVVDVAARCYKRMGTHLKDVVMALPASAVITKKIIVPAGLRDDELELQVESEANQYIPFAMDEVSLDFAVIGPASSSPEDLDVLIAAAKKERIEDRVAIAEAIGLSPAVVDVESYAVLASFDLVRRQLPEEGLGQIVALIDVGATLTTLTVLLDGNLLYTREQAFGGSQLTLDAGRYFGLSFEEAEASKRSGTLPEGYDSELLAPFVESLALEISRALQFFFTSTPYNQVDHIVLSGGCAVIPGVEEVVFARTQVPTRIANPFAGMTLSDKVRPKNLQADAPSLMVACGLAMRRFDPA